MWFCQYARVVFLYLLLHGRSGLGFLFWWMLLVFGSQKHEGRGLATRVESTKASVGARSIRMPTTKTLGLRGVLVPRLYTNNCHWGWDRRGGVWELSFWSIENSFSPAGLYRSGRCRLARSLARRRFRCRRLELEEWHVYIFARGSLPAAVILCRKCCLERFACLAIGYVVSRHTHLSLGEETRT